LFEKYFANEYIDNAEKKNSLRDFVATFFMSPEKFYFILFHKLFCFWWQWE